MEELLPDLKYAVRMLAKNRSFTIVAVLTLALGIGANTALFSVANGVLLSPLPFPAPNQLVALYAKRVSFERASISYPNFLDWQRDNRSFAAMAAFRQDDFNLTGAGEAEHIRGEMVSADFFATLGVKLVAGRFFTPDEDRIGGAPVALISAGLWTRKFGAAPNLVGQRITLNGTDYTIIGVVFPDRSAGLGMKAIGRLKPGVTVEQARAEMNSIANQLAEAYPVADQDSGITVMPLKQSMVGEIEPFLFVLLAAVGFVLLIACVNVANLVLARSTGRAREFAIRAALGASRGRVLRQLLTESTLIALAGGAVGLLLAAWGTQGILTLVSDTLPRAQEVRVDGRVLLFTLGISLISGILFGLAPALRAARVDAQSTLKEGGRGA